MLEQLKQCIPLFINCLFSIICLTFLQLLGQQIYLLITEILILILGVFFYILAAIKAKEKFSQTNHSSIFFIILLLIEFGNLLYYGKSKISENLLCLLIGCMLSQQKIKSKEKEDKRKIQLVRTFLQSITIFIIFILYIVFRNIDDEIQFLILSSILIIVVFSMQIYINEPIKMTELKEITTGQQMRQSINTQQLTISNAFGFWEKVLEQQIIFLSIKNNDITIERISQYLQQYLKEKNFTIEEYLKKINLFSISYESENILSNNMIETKGSFYNFIRELLTDEKLSATAKSRKSRDIILNDQQQRLISPNNESRSRLQSMQRTEMLQKGYTLNLQNISVVYISDNQPLSGSLTDFLNPKPGSSEPASPSTSKKIKLLGFLQSDKSIYKKITFTTLGEKNYLIEIEDDSVDYIKKQTSDILVAYRQQVTQVQSQVVTKLIIELTQKFNTILNNNRKENAVLNLIQTQIFLLDVWSQNFTYFLQDGLSKHNQQQFNVVAFVRAVTDKLQHEKSVMENLIMFKVTDDLRDKTISTDRIYLKQILINLILNSIKAYRRPDISNTIQINISQTQNDEILFEIIDIANGFSAPLDLKRVRDGKLGIFICQKLLPQISKNQKLQYQTITFEDQKKGTLVSFSIPRNLNAINNSYHNQSMNFIQSESIKLAQIQQSQIVNNNQIDI